MTLNEARRLFRSLRYYDRLSETIRDKEARLMYLIDEYHLNRLDGYEVSINSGGIVYRKLIVPKNEQLSLPIEID